MKNKSYNDLKNKHLTLDDRIEIVECLAKGMTFKAIAKRIGKSASTVSREIKAHAQLHKNGFVKTDQICPRLLRAPFVCNGCDKKSRNSCQFPRRVYVARKAQADYEALLKEARTGIPLNKESFYETERIISAAVKSGQHVYHAILANNLPISTSTVYRHIKRGYFTISPIDLPRSVKFKPRHPKESPFVPHWARQGRTYQDYLAYLEDHPGISTVQLDTVIGKVSGKVIMTIHFVNCDFMIGILLDNKTAPEAASKFSALKSRLRSCGFDFGELFPVMLTDNGGEFSDVHSFENGLDGVLESHLFFCDSNASYEKPHIEKNHTLFRDIAPSGTSFDDFSQDTIDLIFSHVNAVKRRQFNGKSAYDLFTFTYSPELANVLGIVYVPPQQVIQSPLLLK